MNEISIRQFQDAIRATHGCEATFTGIQQPVDERFGAHRVWTGEVLVFDLPDHPTASHCYAWSVDGRVTAVLHEGPVDSPETAVRAASAAEQRCVNCGARLIQGDSSCLTCGHAVK